MELRPGNAQWIGRRAEQQDAFGFAGLTPDWHCGAGGVLVVLADGMGGMEAGGEASRLAVRTMMASYRARGPEESIPQALSRALAETNRAVYDLACRGAGEGNTGTTLVAVAVQEGRLHWIAAGDSRLYLYRGADGSLNQVTRDHNHRADLLQEAALGRLTRAQVESDPDGAALTSFVGMAEVAQVDRNLYPLTLAAGDRLLLASDGVYGVLSPQEMAAALRLEAQAGADALIGALKAKARDSQDNATAAILECRAGPAAGVSVPAPARRRSRWPLILAGFAGALALGLWIGRDLETWLRALGHGWQQSPPPVAENPAAPSVDPATGTRPAPVPVPLRR